MAQNEENKQIAVLAAVDSREYDAEESLRELEELAQAAGAQVEGVFLQKLSSINAATYLGPGKLEEIREFCRQREAELLIVDDELSGIQLRNMEQAVDVRVVDRTMLILDIFAQRAVTSEGKLQVELAQQKYMMPRLIGLGSVLSRQGGGIGTRGPGESQLETDRRHIRRRIDALSRELKEMEKHRAQMRRRREKSGVPVIAIVGYTNVGKSTLLNRLTDAGVLEKNQLFATLDPTARELRLPDGQTAVLIDTVGLIRRLPHQLVEAFHSTLEEAANADLILNLCDITSPDADEQLQVTQKLLEELGCGDTPVITVFNKIDVCPDREERHSRGRTVFLSAREGLGFDDLLEAVCRELSQRVRRLELLIPYTQGSLLDQIRRQGRVFSESYEETGTRISANVDVKLLKAVAPYVLERGNTEEEDR